MRPPGNNEDIDEDIRKKAQPYINSGLAENFAVAIAKGIDSEKVMALWESEWWKQYPDDDLLILKMLSKENPISIEDGEWLNDIRSDHERLVMSCIHELIDIAFAKALIDGGFGKYPDAVNDVLDGGEPELIARMRNLKDYRNLPPGLGSKVVLPEEQPKQTSTRVFDPISAFAAAQNRKML